MAFCRAFGVCYLLKCVGLCFIRPSTLNFWRHSFIFVRVDLLQFCLKSYTNPLVLEPNFFSQGVDLL